jgi:ABC-type dipeptide/oligopeptide/nickel transport system ATPase subunit
VKIKIHNKTTDFNTYRANRVKSLFNPERGNEFKLEAEFDLPDGWGIGVVVGPSGSGKTSIGRSFFGENKIVDLYAGWDGEMPIVDCIAPGGKFDVVTGSLSAVGLGDVPAWLRPFHALSNGQQFRAGLARVMCSGEPEVVVDEFTSVVDRQIAKIGALAFAKSWRRQPGRRCVLLSCHYDILDWVEPDWVFDTGTGKFTEKKTADGSGQKLSLQFGRSTQVTGSFLKNITI